MNTKKIINLTLCLIITGTSFSQTQELSGFKKFSSHAISPIFQGKEVKGYTLFYKSDKADKGNDNFHIAVYDENLTKSATIDLQKPRGKTLLLGNAFNGTDLAFYFYNFKDKRFEIETYDKSLKKVASVNLDRKLSNVESMVLAQKREADEKDQAASGYDMNIFPVENKGFIINGTMKWGKGYTLEMFDNDLKSKWKYATDEESKVYETLIINEVNDKYLMGYSIKRDGMMSHKMTYYVVAFDANTGKKFLELPVEGDAHEQLSLNTVSYDESSKQIVVLGDYYAETDKPGVSKSRGFYIKTFSDQGKEVDKKFYSWDKDVKNLLPEEAKPSIEKGAMNFTHKIIKGKDGKTYIVCEQFSRAANGGAILGAALMGRQTQSFVKAVVWNIIIYVLNPDMTLSEVKFYPKDKSNVDLPPGAEYQGDGILGLMTKMENGFDYQFTQMTNDGKSFDVVYIDYDKEKGESTKRILGNIIIAPDGKFNLDKMDITSKATSSNLFPAKPGYLMMVDFLKKERTVGMKMIKLNY